MGDLSEARVGISKLKDEGKYKGLPTPLPGRQPPPGATARGWPQSIHYALVACYYEPHYGGSLYAGIICPTDSATM